MEDFLIKYIIQIIGIIISALTLCKGWVFPTDGLSEKRQKMSKFIYELYKISEEEHLKKLSMDYGYAAITKESILNAEQRKCLLSSPDPMKNIDCYRKCSDLVSIRTSPLLFEWKFKRYNSTSYKIANNIFFGFFYFIGCYLVILPLIYQISPLSIIASMLQNIPFNQRILWFFYLIIIGCIFSLVSINRITKIRMAIKLIKNQEG